jgi:hypothetical protein
MRLQPYSLFLYLNPVIILMPGCLKNNIGSQCGLTECCLDTRETVADCCISNYGTFEHEEYGELISGESAECIAMTVFKTKLVRNEFREISSLDSELSGDVVNYYSGSDFPTSIWSVYIDYGPDACIDTIRGVEIDAYSGISLRLISTFGLSTTPCP